MDWQPILISLISGLLGGGGLATVLKARAENDKIESETITIQDKLNEAVLGRALKMLNEAQEENQRLRTENAALRGEAK